MHNPTGGTKVKARKKKRLAAFSATFAALAVAAPLAGDDGDGRRRRQQADDHDQRLDLGRPARRVARPEVREEATAA